MPVDFVDATKLGCVKGGNIKKKENEMAKYGVMDCCYQVVPEGGRRHLLCKHQGLLHRKNPKQ